jgi:uncharacterized protein
MKKRIRTMFRGLASVSALFLRLVAQLALSGYRVALSPALGPCCRFAPSCSVYASQAINRYGLMRGGWMGLRRLFRCHPFHAGGWDPVG